MDSIDFGLNIFFGTFFFVLLAYVIYKNYWTRKLFGLVEGIPEVKLSSIKEAKQKVASDFRPPKAEISGQLYEVDNEVYRRFIILRKSSLAFLAHKLEEHADLSCSDEMEERLFLMAERDELQILQIPNSISFSRYHDFASWFMFDEKNRPIPESCLGVAFHLSDRRLDYCFWKNSNIASGDTLMGVFRNGNAFSIYLPEMDQARATIRLRKDLKAEAKSFETRFSHFELSKYQLDSLDYESLNIRMNPYA